MKMTGRRCVSPKKELRKLWSLIPPGRRLSEFPQFSAPRVHVLLRRAIELLLSSGPGLASVIVNTFLVTLPLIARQNWEIASLAANLVIGGPDAIRSVVLDPLEVILVVDEEFIRWWAKLMWQFCYKPFVWFGQSFMSRPCLSFRKLWAWTARC